ncbi:MAG: hypothetical protein AAFO87_06320 [Cyanobacteria bacterium J06607_6]
MVSLISLLCCFLRRGINQGGRIFSLKSQSLYLAVAIAPSVTLSTGAQQQDIVLPTQEALEVSA